MSLVIGLSFSAGSWFRSSGGQVIVGCNDVGKLTY